MLHSINLIRVLSCLAIAIFHCTEFVNGNSDTVQWVFNLAGPGFHLFLLVSGVTLIVVTKPTDSPLNFMAKRIARVAPLYWVLTTVAIAMVLFRHWLLPYADLSMENIISSYLFLPYEDHGNRIHPILFVGWTLGYILLFYGLFALSLLFPVKWQNLATVSMLLSVMLLSQLIPSETYQRFYGDPILLEFAAGCLIGYLIFLPQVKAFVQRTPMWPFALVGTLGLFTTMQTDVSGLVEVAMYASAGGILVFACAGQDLYRQPLRLGILNSAAVISYGFYLIHPLIIPVFGAAIYSVIGLGVLGSALVILTVLPVTAVIAYATYRIIEIPSNRYFRRILGVNAQPAPSLIPSSPIAKA